MTEPVFRTGVVKPIECVKEGFELIKPDYWLMFAISLVAGLIGGISMFIAAGAMTCGLFYCFIRKFDGEPVKFDDLFKGMQWFLPGLVVTAFIVVPILVVYAVLYVPMVLAAAMGSHLSETELFQMLGAAFAVDAVLLIIMVCLHTLLVFAYPLVADRGLGGISAMVLSARAVLKNLGGIAALMAVNFLLVLAGELAFCVGIYFVLPIMIAGTVVAYRKIFPASELRRNMFPPPPAEYRSI